MVGFFFQAEDGIRDGHVTGVQTCALPIWTIAGGCGVEEAIRIFKEHENLISGLVRLPVIQDKYPEFGEGVVKSLGAWGRSEERRVGKECGRRRGREEQREQYKATNWTSER